MRTFAPDATQTRRPQPRMRKICSPEGVPKMCPRTPAPQCMHVPQRSRGRRRTSEHPAGEWHTLPTAALQELTLAVPYGGSQYGRAT